MSTPEKPGPEHAPPSSDEGARTAVDSEPPAVRADAGPGPNTLHSVEPGEDGATGDVRPETAAAGAPEPGAKAGSARLVHGDEIARGGMASIRVAFDTVLLRRVAVKRLRGEGDSEYKARFFEEAQVTAQLDHPNVVPVHDVGLESDSEPFFTMKLVEGHTLTQVVDELHRHELTPERLHPILQIFLKVCDAVSFAHSRGVVHRDLKPDNIMVGTHGQVYVMDWGVARLLARTPEIVSLPCVHVRSDSATSQHVEKRAIVGTPDYMAPEQALVEPWEVDERSDVFGLGGILYYLLTGLGPYSKPKSGSSLAQRGPVDPPEEHGVWPRLPPGLCQIAMRALAHEKHLRYQNVEELRGSVEEFLLGGGWFATQRYRAGDLIVREGEVGESAYIITEGQCEVYRIEEGVKQPLRELGPGEVFGETAVLTRKPRTATVAALSDVTVKVVTRVSLDNELRRNPWLDAFVRSLAERFREADAEVASHRRSRASSGKR
jgi:eukaryotic-like serine/threonine-protein kinase